MLPWSDLVIVLFLSYYLTGLNMVAFHTRSHPVDRPGYVRLGPVRRTIAGAMWPVVGRANRELGWFTVCFISGAIVIGVEYRLLSAFVAATFWRTTIVWIACVTPVVNAPIALVSTLLWLLLAKPLGLRFRPEWSVSNISAP